MFDIGFQELLIVFVVALFVVDPAKLPELSRKLGKWVNVIRGGMNEMKMQMEGGIKEIMPKNEYHVSSLINKMDAGADYQRTASLNDTATGNTDEKDGA
jgi:Tat protein translocase TatB subunit